MKNILIVLGLFTIAACSSTKDAPLADGEHDFQHKFSEHPHIESIQLKVSIEGNQVTVLNQVESKVFKKGVLEQGELFWHQKTGKWAIVHSEKDKSAEEVGGCSDGPYEIDLEKKIYWTC